MNYAKSFAAIVATALAALAAALTGDNTISSPEWVNIAIMSVGAAGVFAAPNVPGSKYTKSVLAALTAGLTVLASTIIGGITQVELIQIALAVSAAVGVYAVPNKPAVK